jgi:bifunctional oligoribonuclease and PAP phosphatase NrnA
MALTPIQQLCEMIKKCSNPLIIMPQNPEGDAVGSALALFLVLKKMNKNPEIACSTALAEKFLFLPGSQSIKHNLASERLYKISLDVAGNDIKELSYEQAGSMLNIYLAAKDDDISRDSLALEPSKFKYDLVLIAGSPDLESLGRLYFENTELFFQTPIINIDHHPSNEFFGTVNLIEVTSPSTAEIVAGIAQNISPEAVDGEIATLLLAGIISETNNFQNPNINPKTFTLAASLLSGGAAQEEIIRHFYKTKSLAVLRLIGRIINNMSFDSSHCLAWAALNRDFKKTETNPRDIDAAVNELVNNSKDIDILLVTWVDSEIVTGNIWLDKKYDAKLLATELGGERKNHKIIISENQMPENEFAAKTLEKLKLFIEQSRKNLK